MTKPKVEILRRDLPDFSGDAWLVGVKKFPKGKYFVVSGTYAAFSGWEVLVFPADSKGNVTDWGEVAGGREMTHEEAIADLEEILADEEPKE